MILSFFFTLSAAFADVSSCPAIRLDSPGGSMAGMPRYTQNNLGHCFAVTAAQMIDAYRFSHGDRKKSHLTSPIAVAANYKYTNRSVKAETLQYYRDNKAKLVKQYGQKGYDRMLKFLTVDEPAYVFPVETYAAKVIASGWIDEVFGYIYRDQKGLYKSCDQSALDKSIQYSSDFENIISFWKEQNLKDTAKISYPTYIHKMIAKACEKNSVFVVLPNATSYGVTPLKYHEDLKGFKPRLNAAFSISNPQPVGISYCSEILEGIKSEMPAKCLKSHASVVIGQRPKAKGGGCEYLVRNSSESCYVKENCENGEYWIDEKILIDSAFRMDILLDKESKAEFEAKLQK